MPSAAFAAPAPGLVLASRGPERRSTAQLGYRDPASTGNQVTAYSDAVELTVCP